MPGIPITGANLGGYTTSKIIKYIETGHIQDVDESIKLKDEAYKNHIEKE